MKKFKITNEKLGVAVFTVIQILCVFIAAAFALQSDAVGGHLYPYYDAIGCLMYLGAAIIIEVVKYKITHNNDNNEETI